MTTTRMPYQRLLLFVFVLTALAADTPAGDLHGDPLPPKARARLGSVRLRHPGHGLLGLAVVSDQALVTVGDDGRVCWWDLTSGKLTRDFSAGGYVRAFALSRDGKLLAVAAFRQKKKESDPYETVVRVLDASTGKKVREFSRGDDHLERGTLALSSDGKMLFSAARDGKVRVEEVATGAELLRENVSAGSYAQLALSPDGKSLVVFQSKVYIWEWQSGNPPRELQVGGRGARSVAFTPDSKTLLTSPDFEAVGVRAWDVATGKLLRTVTGAGKSDLSDVSLSPDGRTLVTVSHRDRGLVIHDFATGKELRRWTLGESWRMGAPLFTPDSRRLVAPMGDGAVGVWDATTGKEVLPRRGHTQPPSFVALLREGVAITAGDDGSARVWNARTGESKEAIGSAGHWIRGAAVSADGKWLATSELGKQHAVRLWDVTTGKQVFRLAGHGRAGGNRALLFTADGRHLLSWGDDMYLRTWDIRNGKAVAEHAIRPDGRAIPDEVDDTQRRELDFMFSKGILTSDYSRLVLESRPNLYVFDAASGKQTLRFAQEEGNLIGFALSPDGKHLLCSSWGRPRQVKLADGRTMYTSGDRVVCLYDLTTGKQLWRREVAKGDERIGQVAVSPDGKLFAFGVGSNPARIEFGDLLTGKKTAAIEAVPASVSGLAFSADGKQIIAGLADTTAVIWDVPPAQK